MACTSVSSVPDTDIDITTNALGPTPHTANDPVYSTPTYVICLDKTRKARCDPTYTAWKQVMSNTQRLKAVTPKDFDLAKVAHPYARSCIRLRERKTLELIGNIVEVACAMSHIKAWQTILASQKPGIVLEDDMAMSQSSIKYMVHQIPHIPKNTDIHLLHFNGVNLKFKKIHSSSSSSSSKYKFVDVHQFTGLLAYYITPQACAKLLEFAFPIVFQVDTYVSRANLKVTTLLQNRMSWFKFMKDGLSTTLGSTHISSHMLVMAIVIFVLAVVVVGLSIAWTTRGMSKRRALQQCTKTTETLQRWKKKHK